MPDYKSMTDEDLMTAFYGCDDSAYAVLDERYRARLGKRAYGLLLASKVRVGELEKAEDLVQTTLLKVVATKHRPNRRWIFGKGSVEQWLFGILRKVVATYLRRKHHDDFCITSETNWIPPGGDDDQASPLAQMAQQREEFESRRLPDCIASLPTKQQYVIRGLFFDNKKQTELAAELGCANSTITNIKNAALAALRTDLEAWCETPL